MIPAPLATSTILILLGANLGASIAIAITLGLVLTRVRDLTAMHHTAIVRLLEICGARPVGPVVQEQFEGEAV